MTSGSVEICAVGPSVATLVWAGQSVGLGKPTACDKRFGDRHRCWPYQVALCNAHLLHMLHKRHGIEKSTTAYDRKLIRPDGPSNCNLTISLATRNPRVSIWDREAILFIYG